MKPPIKTIFGEHFRALGVIFFTIGVICVSCKSDARKLAELGCKSTKMVQDMNLLNTSLEDMQKFQEEHKKEIEAMQKEVLEIQARHVGDENFMKEYVEEIQKLDDCPDDVKQAVKSTLNWMK